MVWFAGTIRIISHQSRSLVATISFAATLALPKTTRKDRMMSSLNLRPFSIPAPSPPTPSHFPLPLPHHPHPPSPLCLSLTTHSPLPLPHHPHPPIPLCLFPHHPHPTDKDVRGGRKKSEKKRANAKTWHNSSPAHLSAFIRNGTRNFASLFVSLADDTATDDTLSPHSSPMSTTAAFEGRTRLLLTDLRGISKS
ncbi:hypothetical protein BLNAU_7464 [Blattamonas nauphoetae]|uniref:Uncharacterized protein n=1 Tax=Blattamonas nauphoetae TaxID=2049346 RepID=A0ABQ9Y1F9_9EUKA|nr:hypothetical protein BLNAU_7464 [Blattamonas nauphoetae]